MTTTFYQMGCYKKVSVENLEYWKKQLLAHWDFLDFLSKKRFLEENIAHEALIYTVEKLEEDDWKRLKSYNGDSSLKTYISVVASRLFSDFSRNKFGRVRPPAWLKKQGGLWLELFTRLCLERQTVGEVVENYKRDDLKRNIQIVEEAIAVILSRITDCGKVTGDVILSDPLSLENESVIEPSFHHLTPEDIYHANERVTAINVVGRCITGDSDIPVDVSLKPAVKKLKKYVVLTQEEIFFLKSIYQEGLSVSAAGRLLGWKTNVAAGKHRRLMKTILKGLEKSDLLTQLRDFFE